MRTPTFVMAAAAATALTLYAIPMTPASALPATRLVATTGTDSGSCLVTACKTINFAVGQAASGDTVSVAAGSYAEAVVLSKDITLRGAKQGVSATTGRTDAAQESSIAAPAGNDISYAAPALTGTVDGFTLGGSGVGILALNGGHGYVWMNNIIGAANTGINFMADGTVPTDISNNLIQNADPGGAGTGGVFFTNGPANNVTIADNRFDTNSTDVNTTGGGSGLVVRNNASTGSGNFITLFQTTGALIAANTVTGATSTAFYLDGGNSGATVSDNTVSGGAVDRDGIRIGNAFYTPSIGLTVSGNTVSGRRNGIIVRPSANTTPSLTGAPSMISGNTITGAAQAGIVVLSGAAAGLAITANTASGSGTFDCQDDTTGDASSGTANLWTGDTGVTAQPTGICAVAVATTPPPSTTSAGGSTGASSSFAVEGISTSVGAGGALANTGARTGPQIWVALALLVSGLGVTALGRRRSARGRHES